MIHFAIECDVNIFIRLLSVDSQKRDFIFFPSTIRLSGIEYAFSMKHTLHQGVNQPLYIIYQNIMWSTSFV